MSFIMVSYRDQTLIAAVGVECYINISDNPLQQQKGNKIMKAQKYKQKLGHQLVENYNICAMLLEKEGMDMLNYEEIIYVMFNGQIPLAKIAYFRKKKYRDQEPFMKKEYLVEDGLKLKEEVVGKAWRFQKAADPSNKRGNSVKGRRSEDAIQENSINQQTNSRPTKPQEQQKQLVDKSPVPSPQKHNRSLTTRQKQIEEIRQKKAELEGMMSVLQSKLNTARNEEEAAEYQKEYNRCFKELTFLRNKNRNMKEQSLLKKIAKETSAQVPKKIIDLLKQMNKIKQNNAKILDKEPPYQQKLPKSEQILRLNLIFNHYSKKQVTSTNRYFSDLEKDQNKLKLQTFIKFAQDWHLHRIVSMEQITSLFKARSKGNRFIDQLQFSELLSDVHNLECIKEERPISADSLSQFIQEFIASDAKINKYVLNSKVEEHKETQYRYKPKSHSGKYVRDIEQQMQMRKKTIYFLAGPKNNEKYKERNAKTRNNTLQNSRVDPQITESRAFNLYNPSSVNLNESSNSYAFHFKQKNIKNRIKTQGIIKSIQSTQSYLNHNSNVNEQTQTIDSNRENIANREKREEDTNKRKKEREEKEDQLIDQVLNGSLSQAHKKRNPAFEGFEELIEQSEEDEYLSKHLQLPPIQAKRTLRPIHY